MNDTVEIIYKIVDRIGKTQDDYVKILVEMQVDLGHVKVDLKEHMRRTALLEEEIRVLKAPKPTPWKKYASIAALISAITTIVYKIKGN